MTLQAKVHYLKLINAASVGLEIPLHAEIYRKFLCDFFSAKLAHFLKCRR